MPAPEIVANLFHVKHATTYPKHSSQACGPSNRSWYPAV